MWKTLLFLFYCVLCICVGLLISFLTPHLCGSEPCTKKSDLILHNIDANVDPCDNFYGFVCGNYKRYGKDRNSEISVWEELTIKQKFKLLEYLKKPLRKEDDRVLKTVKNLFKSCMDTKSIDEQGIQPLLNALRQAGGFPLLEGKKWENKTSGESWTMQDIEYTSRYIGFEGGHIFMAYIKKFAESDKIYIHLEPPKYVEFRQHHLECYFRYVKTITKILQSKSEDLDKEINDTLKIQMEISRLTKDATSCANKYKYVTENLKEFSEEFKYFNISHFVTLMIPDVDTMPEKIVVIYNARQYFTGLKSIFESTPIRTVTNYMMIHNIIEVTPFLPTSLRNAYTQLLSEVQGRYLSKEDRNIVCIKRIKSKLSSALSSLYLTNVIKRITRNSYLTDVFLSFKKQLKIVVKDLEWMNKKTKQDAQSKIDVMDFATPVSDSDFSVLTNRTAFRVYYEDLCFTGDQSGILVAFLALEVFKTGKQWELTEREFEVFDKEIDIFSSDVTYDYKGNVVVIPTALLNFPTYNGYWPYYLNYGGLGSRISTELVRGIASEFGSRHDKKGIWNNWWDSKVRDKYSKYSRCVMGQYNNYLEKHTDFKMKDDVCMHKFVETIGGALVAFRAYNAYDSERFFSERKLAMIPQFSPQQLFFIDLATYHCTHNAHSFRQNMSESDMVTGNIANEYMVLSSLMNFKEFNDLFDCSKSAKMNPQQKCNLWEKPPKKEK